MKRLGWVATYSLTALFGLVFAVFISTSMMARGHAQSPAVTTTEPGGVTSGPTTTTTTVVPSAATPPAAPPPPPPSNELPPDVPAQAQDQSAAQTAPPSAPPTTVPKGPVVPPKGKAVPPPSPAAGAAQGALPPAVGNAPAAGTAVGTEEYVYDGTGRRDPFRRYRSIHADGKTLNPADLDPLLRYDIDQLTLVGILWDVRQPRALVRDSDGGVHTLVKNTKLGHNNGFVAAIREGEVVVVETFDEEGGGTVKRTRILELRTSVKK